MKYTPVLLAFGLLFGLISSANAQQFPNPLNVGAGDNNGAIELYFNVGEPITDISLPLISPARIAALRATYSATEINLADLGLTLTSMERPGVNASDPGQETLAILNGTPSVVGGGNARFNGTYRADYQRAFGRGNQTLTLRITICESGGVNTGGNSVIGATQCTPPDYAPMVLEAPQILFVVGRNRTVTLPEISRGGTGAAASSRISYALSNLGALATAGLSFDAATRRLSGNPTAAVSTTPLIYTATDFASGETVQTEVMVRIHDPSGDNYHTLPKPADRTINVDETVSFVLPQIVSTNSDTSIDSTTYSLDTSAVPGINFNANSRTLSGTPTAIAETTLNYRAMIGSVPRSASFTISVAGASFAAIPPQTYLVDNQITRLILPAPTGPGGPFQILNNSTAIDAIALGLENQFFTDKIEIFGTPTATGAFDVSYAFFDRYRNRISTTVNITVAGPPVLAAVQDQIVAFGSTLELNGSLATGGRPDSAVYRYRSAAGSIVLPDGFTVSANGRTLTTSASLPIGTYNLTYTVTDDFGRDDVAFAVIVYDPSITLPTLSVAERGLVFPVNMAVDMTLPVATGGLPGVLSYSLELSNGTDFANDSTVSGLSYTTTADGGVLSGTPDTVMATPISLTYTAADALSAGSNSLTYTVTITALNFPSPIGIGTAAANIDLFFDTSGAITPLIFPEVEGGAAGATAEYAITGAGLAALGLDFAATSRTLSGTPSVVGGPRLTPTSAINTRFTGTYVATVGLSSASIPLSFTLCESGAVNIDSADNSNVGATTCTLPAFEPLVLEVAEVVIPTRTPSSQQLPQVSRGGLGANPRLSYTLTGGAIGVFGLTYDSTTRTLSGSSPPAVIALTPTYTATDFGSGESIMQVVSFNLISNTTTDLPDPADRSLLGNTLIDITLPPAVGVGAAEVTYAVDTAALPGLTFTPSSRALSGILASAPAAATTLTYTARHAASSIDLSETFEVSVVFPALNFATSQMDFSAPADSALNRPLSLATGGSAPLIYALTDSASAAFVNDSTIPGLTFAADPPRLHGTPTTPGAYSLNYSTTDSRGTALTAAFTVTITPAAITFTASPPSLNLNFALGQPGSESLPTAGGGVAPLTYNLRLDGGADFDNTASPGGTVPGLSFNPASGELTGTPTAVTTAPISLTYSASDSQSPPASSPVLTFMLSVTELNLPAQADLTYVTGASIGDSGGVLLPTVTAGTAPYTYTLTADAAAPTNGVLPAWLAISPNTPGAGGDNPTGSATPFTLSGTAPATAGTYNFTYGVTDADDVATSATFSIIIYAPLGTISAISAESTVFDVSATVNLTLPAVVGGLAPINYSLAAVESGGNRDIAGASTILGLNFASTPAGGVLSGTANTAGVVDLVYTATDSLNPDPNTTNSVTFTLTVSAVALADPADLTYATRQAIDAVNLPTATGNIGAATPLTYSLTAAAGSPTGGALPGWLVVTPESGAGNASASSSRLIISATALNPPDSAGTYMFIYAVQEGGARRTQVFSIVIYDALALANVSDSAATFGVGRQVTLNLPIATGGLGDISYTLRELDSVAGNLRDITATESVLGLNFTATTTTSTSTSTGGGILSGTAQATPATATLIYTATDGGDSTANIAAASQSATFTLTIARLNLPTPANLTYAIGDSIVDSGGADLVLPAATDGTPPYLYTLTAASAPPPNTGELPAWLNLSPNTPANSATPYALSGSPTAAGIYNFTYRVQDDAGLSLERPFSITVYAQIAAIEPISGDMTTFAAGASVDYTLPAVVGGLAPITYSLAAVESGGNRDIAGASTILGLTFAHSAAGGVLSGTPMTAGEADLVYTATDAAGNATNLSFTLAITGPTFVQPVDLTLGGPYAAGVMLAPITLPEADSGYADTLLTYTLTDSGEAVFADDSTVPGLVYTAATRELSGTPTDAGAYTLVYTATDGATPPNESTLTFTLTIAGPAFSQPPADLTYRVGEVVGDLVLPIARSGSADIALTYGLTQDSALVSDSTLPVPSEISEFFADFLPDASAAPITAPIALAGISAEKWADLAADVPNLDAFLPLSATFTYTATDPHGNSTADGLATDPGAFTIILEGAAADSVNQTNAVILPEVARAITHSAVGAVTTRISRAAGRGSGGGNSAGAGGASFRLAGHDNIAGVLAARGEEMLENGGDMKKLLAGSGFSMPIKGGGGGDGIGQTTLWASGEYAELSGTSAAVDWSGDLLGFHVGADAKVRPNLLLGLSISRLSSDLAYETAAGGGDYDLDMTSVHPYLGWRAGALDLWASVGLGGGDLRVKPTAGDAQSADLKLSTIGGGLSGTIWQQNAAQMRVKGEVTHSELEADAQPGMADISTAATRIRTALEASMPGRLASGAALTPSAEVGLRHDGGDGETGAGAEVGLAIRYHNPAARFTAEGKMRALLAHSAEQEEWGIQGSLILAPGADGQGLSLNITPSYGDTASAQQRLWHEGLADSAGKGATADNGAAGFGAAATDKTADYAARLNTRVGYGIMLRDGSLIEPYTEITIAPAATYRLGMHWRPPTSPLTLNLLGERYESATPAAATNALILKGEMQF